MPIDGPRPEDFEEPSDIHAFFSTVDWRIALLVPVCAAMFLAVGIGSGSHFDSDDALYAQMAREMVRTGDYFDNQ